MEEIRRCANCGASRPGEYCAECGERRLRPEDRRLSALLGEAARSVLETDGRLWRSLRALILAPGELSADWCRGRRRHWLGPATLFLLVNLLIFLAPPLTDFDLSLGEQIELQPWSPVARELVEARVAARGTDLDAYAARYAATATDVGKALLVVHVPLLALALALVCGPRRRYFAEYVVLALHEFTALLVVLQVSAWTIGPLTAVLLGTAVAARWAFPVLIWTIFLGFCAHAVAAAARVVAPGRVRLVLLGPALLLALALGNLVYRLLQFLLAFALS